MESDGIYPTRRRDAMIHPGCKACRYLGQVLECHQAQQLGECDQSTHR